MLMCGIVGILGTEPVAVDIVDSLRRLEYRGYDSAGVATLEDGKLARVRAEGKLKNLAGKLAAQSLSGHAGIGHTRWATHGAPTERNAHPHQAGNAAGRVAVVHNGIIENFRELRDALTAKGAQLSRPTPTPRLWPRRSRPKWKRRLTAGGGACRFALTWKAHSG
jgi:glucosamine--fructose-6-phosphate aminotransferase (isomerizing)